MQSAIRNRDKNGVLTIGEAYLTPRELTDKEKEFVKLTSNRHVEYPGLSITGIKRFFGAERTKVYIITILCIRHISYGNSCLVCKVVKEDVLFRYTKDDCLLSLQPYISCVHYSMLTDPVFQLSIFFKKEEEEI